MFVEMEIADLGIVRSLFRGHKQYIPVHAVLQGNFPGRVFVDDTQHPAVAVVWALSRWAYIEGNYEHEQVLRLLPDLISRVIIPDSQRMNVNWFELYAPNTQAWVRVLDECFHTFDSGRHYENVYVWDEPTYDRFRAEYSFSDAIIPELSEVPILPERMRTSPFISATFRSCTAVGCTVRVDDVAVALCRSNGLAAGDEFMIDVVTFDKNSRGKGYATAASVGLLDYCREKKLTPLWETTEQNVASQRLAHKLGFVENETYPVYAIRF